MRFLALDLSLTAPGYADSHRGIGILSAEGAGVCRLTNIKNGVLGLALPSADCQKGVDLVGIEGYAFSAHSSSVTKLAELGGAVRVALYEAQIPYVEIPSTCLKKYATGRGNAKKDDVLLAAVRRLGYTGNSKDEADAMWLLEMMRDAYFQARRVPVAHAETLKKIRWPFLC